jgi:predicted ATPase/class 3 adenylate cyclase
MAIFCFTDIEGSTEKWEKHRAVMGQVIAMHNKILETEVARFGGEVIKHTGDGVFAIFEGAVSQTDQPLQCAIEIQKQIQSTDWPGIGELRLRMAFHCGEAEKMAGDYYGTVANRTARLMSLAWGGQILVSDELKNEGILPPEASLVDLGVHQVKDLPEPVQVYGLLHPDLKLKEFPPLKSLSQSPHNLPAQLTPFVGRAKELAEIAAFFAGPGHRLLTLRGSGGMGKTRLCIQAGLEGLRNYKHGVYFVPLVALTAPSQIVAKIAEYLRLTFYSGEDQKIQLLNYLKDKELLLILDNFDHLLLGVEILSDILRAAPKVKILASCRSRLNHSSESVIEVQGLDFPEAMPGLEIKGFGAVQLFTQRARKVKADFSIKPEEEALVVRICKQLEGMPLGLELAAAWVRTLPLKDICRRLEASIALLVSTEKDLPERQRSMRAVFDYSWKFLTLEEQKMFQNLSVFMDGFSGDAAAVVAQCAHGHLSALVNKSLLRAGDDGRYEVHESLRQFAQAKLDQNPADKQKILDFHGRYYLQFLKGKEPAMKGLGQAKGLAEIRRDFGNIKRAWKWAVERGWVKQLGQGARALSIYADMMCLQPEWQPLMEQAFGLWGGQEMKEFEGVSLDESLRVYATLYSILAQLLFDTGNAPSDETARCLEKSVKIFKKVQDKVEAAYGLVLLSRLDIAEAAKTACLNEAASIYRLSGDRNGEAWAKAGLGVQLWEAGQNPEGKRMLSECLAVFRELGNQREEARCLMALGSGCLEEGKKAEGLAQVQAAKQLFIQLGDWEEAGWAMNRLGHFFSSKRAWAEALPYVEEALKIFGSLQYDKGMQAAFKNLAGIHWALEDFASALALTDRFLAYADSLPDAPWKKGRAFMEKAEILLRLGNFEEALGLSAQGLQAMQNARSVTGAAEAMEVQADIHVAMGNFGIARELYKKANLDFTQGGPAWHGRRAWSFVRMADMELAMDRRPDAFRNYGRALNLVDHSGLEDFAVAVLRALAAILIKEKKHLDALRFLALSERMNLDPKLVLWKPRSAEKTRQETSQQLADLGSKLIQSTVDETRAWAKAAALGPFFKETLAKYCS